MRRRLLPHLAGLFCFLLSHLAVAQAVGDYQSAASGNWNALATWVTWNGTAWAAAGATPTSANGAITILSTHTVTVTAAVTVDQVTVNAGATLNTSGAIILTVANGTGVDLQIDGTFGDASSGSVSFTGTWQMGASGTLIKTTASASNAWQSAYQGGITNIPATANWIIRKIANANPPMSSTTPATGSVYPNLTIENSTANAWIVPAASSFSGTTARVTVKGNLDIGGSGTSVVDFLSTNTFASPTLVQGNLIVRAGNSIRNYGTGFELQGDAIINGVIQYDNNDTRGLTFSGSNYQSFSGTGWPYIYNMTMNKSGGALTLARTITIDNSLTMTSGIINSSLTNLVVCNKNCTTSGASNSSYVEGPVRYLGLNAFRFPIGKNLDYKPTAISGYTATTTPFWTENFNNGCSSLCLGSAYSGANGAWTMASTGTNDAKASQFFVSCTENGNAVGACGTGCAGDATLHVANVSGSPAAAFFCPSGDCGAAYDAGLGGTTVRTSRRMESPTINCTNRYDMQVNFKYMEGGENIADNATFWYFDGTTWTQLADMAKTVLCGAQGTWTAYMVTLPSSADNNPNVKIGFQWVNNDNGAGADPSFAVDNVSVQEADFFTAEYFYSDPAVPYGNTLAPTLAGISTCEYWILNRAHSSTAATQVTVCWDAFSCPVSVLADLRVARYDGISTWQDEGNGGTTGNTSVGSVLTGGNVTSFSPFTIATVLNVPLPVELVSFTAHYDGAQVNLGWTTATEVNNDYFTVERSKNGEGFSELFRKPGAGNSTIMRSYSGVDPQPYEGLSYYRLRQTDFNGQYSFSRIVPVEVQQGSSTFGISNVISANDQLELHLSCDCSGSLNVEVYDLKGRRIYAQQIDQPGQQTSVYLSTTGWAESLYLVKVSDGTHLATRLVRR